MAGRPIVLDPDMLLDAEKNTRPKYSHGEDFDLDQVRYNGRVRHAKEAGEPSAFSTKDKAETGLIVRQPL